MSDWSSAPLPPAVTFDYTKWITWYPDFKNVSEGLAQSYFWRASQLCQNNAASPVLQASAASPYYFYGQPINTDQLHYFLNLLTCHIAWLNAPQIDGLPNDGAGSVPPAPIVGRISQATEGSVSVAADLPNMPMGAAWFMQTKWGLEFWQASAAYRQGPYISPYQSRRSLWNGLRPWAGLRRF